MSDPIIAIIDCDFDAAEELRGTLSDGQVAEIVDTYHRLTDWPPKDIAIHMLQDCTPGKVRSVMQDGLKSPTADSRAIAYCSLTENFDLFPTLLQNGFVSPELVDRAIKSKFST